MSGGEGGGPSEVAKSVAWECGVEKGLNAVLGDGEGWLSENVVLVMVRYYSFIEGSFNSFMERERITLQASVGGKVNACDPRPCPAGRFRPILG